MCYVHMGDGCHHQTKVKVMTAVIIHKTAKTIQGASWLTERKEFEIGGLVQMRLRQLKGDNPSRYYDRIVIADVFSGSGENVLSAHDNPIDGSPLRLLWALQTATHTRDGISLGGLRNKKVDFFFSDIRPDATASLANLLADRWDIPEGLNVGKITATLPAHSALTLIHQEMLANPRTHLILVLDPNGPKDFPRDEALSLLRSFSNRIDLIPYISATSINRCLQHKNKCNAQYNWWLSSIERFDTGFALAIAQNRYGWIREPVQSDHQKWLMLPTFTPKLVPRNDWNKQGYVEINSQRGRAALDFYTGNLLEAV